MASERKDRSSEMPDRFVAEAFCDARRRVVKQRRVRDETSLPYPHRSVHGQHQVALKHQKLCKTCPIGDHSASQANAIVTKWVDSTAGFGRLFRAPERR